jgi:hypothetical protein
MEWGGIISGLAAAAAVAIGIPLALRSRKKTAAGNVKRFFQHLGEMGVKASLVEKGIMQEKVGISRGSGQRAEGVIKIEGRNIDYINVISVTSQYGVRYFLDYLVTSPSLSGGKKKKTKMVMKKSSAIRGRVTDVEWKGDDYLSQTLNFDYRLKDKLLQTELKELKDSISIFPEPKYEYTRVRTNYLLPSPDLFEAIDIIAKYVKSGW